MWRNVFGHAIYQIIILNVIIFYGPGWLVKDYWTQCLVKGTPTLDDPLACDSWNPYYASTLYQNEETLSWWKEKDIKNSEFD